MHSQEMRPIFVYFYEIQLFSISVVYISSSKVYTSKEVITPTIFYFDFSEGL